MSSDGKQETTLEAIADHLEDDLDRLTELQLQELARFKSYSDVPVDDLVRSSERNVARVVATLRGQVRLPPEVVEDERSTGRLRGLQGIPVEDVVEAYRAVIGCLRDAFLEEATARGVGLDTALEGVRRLWQLADSYSSELVNARQQVLIELTRRRELDRFAFVQNLLTGTYRDEELTKVCAAQGLRLEQPHYVMACSSGRPPSDHQLLRTLGTAIPSDDDVMFGTVNGVIAGISSSPPARCPEGLTLLHLGPVPITDIPAAYAEARSLLDVALRLGRVGIVSWDEVALVSAVLNQPRLGEALVERYIAPVFANLPRGAELIDSVRTYIECDKNVAAAASRLSIHVNTLRYRLDRYEHTTGADLRDFTETLRIWWALTYAESSQID